MTRLVLSVWMQESRYILITHVLATGLRSVGGFREEQVTTASPRTPIRTNVYWRLHGNFNMGQMLGSQLWEGFIQVSTGDWSAEEIRILTARAGPKFFFFLKKKICDWGWAKRPWYVKWYVLLLSWNSASSLFLKIWESGHGDTIIIPALGTFLRLRKEDCKSQTSLGYIVRVRFHFNKPKQQENTTNNKTNSPPPEILSLVFFK